MQGLPTRQVLDSMGAARCFAWRTAMKVRLHLVLVLTALSAAHLPPQSGPRRVPRASSQEGSCPPSWLPTFGRLPESCAAVSALVVHDDGSGPALYAGWHLADPSGAEAFVSRWDGAVWSPIGSMTGFGARVL